jgi:hypothetical protein
VKNILLTSAFFVGGTLTFLVLSFGASAEPDEFDVFSVFFAIGIGIVFSAPLWLLALLPKRSTENSIFFRWSLAISLLYPIKLFGGAIVNFFERLITDRGPSFFGLVVGLVPTVFCILSIGYLIWPEVSNLLTKSSIKQDS